jgi:hypothetical protein
MIVVAVEFRPARIDILLLLPFVLCHVHIVAGAVSSGDTGSLPYAGQR